MSAACARGTIEVALIAYNHDGTAQNVVAKSIPIHSSGCVRLIAQRGLSVSRREIDLPKGDVFLETGIYDRTANHAGTLAIPLHVAALAAE